MTLKRYLPMCIAIIFLCSAVTAISLIKEGPPASLPANATVTLGESILVRQDMPVHLTLLSIERVHPANSTPAAEILIALKVSNAGNERVKARVSEDQRLGVRYPDSYEKRYHNYQGIQIPYYSWDITLEPGSTRTITYRIIPEGLGMIAFTSAMVTDEYGNQFESAPTMIKISCVPNGVCDTGENTIFCPHDCPSGGADGICDGIPDGRIDPDCQPGYDSDAISTPAPTTTPKSPSGAFLGIIAVLGALAVFFGKKGAA
jgi:hypothetical protein